MPKIYLQRHTKPDVEPQLCYGVSDIPLCEEYESDHLPLVLERIRSLSVERLYTSPLKRCFILACDIKREMQISNIVVDNRIMELNFGEWEMLHWDNIYKSAEGKAWFDDFIYGSTLGGESFNDVVERVGIFLEQLKFDDRDALVVTHSGVIRAAMVVVGMVAANEVFGVEINYGDLIELDL